jgi:iron complex outermembrane receptor protein
VGRGVAAGRTAGSCPRASDYGLVNLKASAKIYRWIALEGGVNHVLDKHYALVEGFPEEGRNYFVNLVINHL